MLVYPVIYHFIYIPTILFNLAAWIQPESVPLPWYTPPVSTYVVASAVFLIEICTFNAYIYVWQFGGWYAGK